MGEHWDIISLRGLSAVGSHGVHEFERLGSQVFSADLNLYVDSRQAAKTDDVGRTVDYSKLAEQAVSILSGPSKNLIETLANELAEVALRSPLVQKVEVTVHKPMAPVHHYFEDISVRVVRQRQGVPEQGVAEQGETSAPPTEVHSAQEPMPEPEVQPTPDLPKRRPRSAPKLPQIRPPRGSAGAPLPAGFARPEPDVVVLSLGSNQGDSRKILADAVSTLRQMPGFEVTEVSPLVRTKALVKPGTLPQRDYWNAVVIGATRLSPPVLLAALQEIETSFGRVRTQAWGPRTLDIDIVEIGDLTLLTRDLTVPHPLAKERAFVLLPWFLIDPEATLKGAGPVAALLEAAPDRGGVREVQEQWPGRPAETTPPPPAIAARPQDAPEPPQATPKPPQVATTPPQPVSVSPQPAPPTYVAQVPAAAPAPGVSTPTAVPPPPTRTRRSRSEASVPNHVASSFAPPEPTASEPENASVFEEKISMSPQATQLPNWRSAHSPGTPRIVDDPWSSRQTSEGRPARRRVTMRPTPTGSIPVMGVR